jgi:hypothetical protein
MTMIISLNRDVAPPGDDATGMEAGVGEPAQIILFPGVRYERWADDSRNAMSERSSESEAEQSERDWLEV